MELLQKLKLLEENISILENIKNDLKLEDISANKRYEWELRYGLFESIQIMIDISCKIASHYNLGNPKNYRECIELMGKFNFLNTTQVKKYISMIGLRNLLIHEYATIDSEKLYAFLESIDDFKSFIEEIKTHVCD